MHRLRAWLRLNKIFFETVSALALAIAAIAISCFQALELSQQNKLIALQTRLDEARELPNFEFKLQTQGDGSEVLTVTNTGGIPTQLQVDAVYNMRVSAFGQGSLRYVVGTISLWDYYPSQQHTRLAKGDVAVLVAPLAKRVSDIENKLQKAHTGFHSISAKGATNLKIEYQDVLGGRHIQFFEVGKANGAFDMTPEQGLRALADPNQGDDDVDFAADTGALDVDDIVKRLETVAAQPPIEHLVQ